MKTLLVLSALCVLTVAGHYSSEDVHEAAKGLCSCSCGDLETKYPDLIQLKLAFLRKLEAEFSTCGEQQPCGDESSSFIQRLLDLLIQIAEGVKVEQQHHEESLQVGSLRGIPGVHFPNYTEIPITSFSCAEQKYIPGFYADIETGCQVFHVCYEHRRESFLCPVGTTFNQPILACDYWYSSNCSQSSVYHEDIFHEQHEEVVQEEVHQEHAEEHIEEHAIEEMVSEIVEQPEAPHTVVIKHPDELKIKKLLAFLPIKAKILHLKDAKLATDAKLLAEAKLMKLAAMKAADVKIAKVAAMKAADAKLVKLAAMKAADAKIVKAAAAKKVIIPVVAKSAMFVAPVIKTKVMGGAISPLTKKALALGYIKLLKAKKLAVMG